MEKVKVSSVEEVPREPANVSKSHKPQMRNIITLLKMSTVKAPSWPITHQPRHNQVPQHSVVIIFNGQTHVWIPYYVTNAQIQFLKFSTAVILCAAEIPSSVQNASSVLSSSIKIIVYLKNPLDLQDIPTSVLTKHTVPEGIYLLVLQTVCLSGIIVTLIMEVTPLQ